MPNASEGTADGTDDSVPAEKVSPFAGFAASMTAGLGTPPADDGEPKIAKAVETSEKVEAPKPDAVKSIETPAKDDVKPADAPTVNFDGLSDESKTFWEKALKAGHATPADVERALTESLFKKFQPTWTQRNQAIADAKKAVEKDRAELDKRKEDIALLDKIRGSERHMKAWEKMTKGELPPSEDDEDLADKKSVRQIAREELEAKEAAKAAAEAKEQAEYESRRSALQGVVTEQIGALEVTPEVMNGYLLSLEKKAPRGVDPILHFTPSELVRELALVHRDAEIAALKEQLNQKTSKSVQAAKQSLSPPGRATEPPKTGLRKVMQEAGVAQLSDIQGFGWPKDRQ